MKKFFLPAFLLLFIFLQGLFAGEPTSARPLSETPDIKSSKQLVLVLTKKWNSVPGTVWRFQRADEHAPWKKVGNKIPVVVGRNGLAWGKGVNPPVDLPGPKKQEGDGKSPAGIFVLSSAFGLAEPQEVKNVKLPYQPLSSVIECVDDVQSVHYNSIVDRSKVEKVDWNSSEKMREVGEQYRWGVVVDHNTNPRLAAGGSCIFMHIWKGSRTGTSGCTAMSRENMEKFLPWLDSKDHPVLVQLPESEYNRLRKDWQLPRP
jgi:L,D-peptidoglycan transpeptidase YkuD (ErfK/YbiS/YcfS/YnhG family)